VGNIPPALLGALVDKNVWTPAQGLAYAWQMSNKTQRAEALAELAPHLSASLLREGLTTARTIKDVGAQAQAMLVSRLGALGYGQEALVAVQTIEQEDAREQVLAELAPHLAELLQTETLQEALAAVRTIEQGDNRELALEKLAPHLSEPLLREALAVARTIKDAYYRGLALVKLAPHLSESLQAVTFQEALAAARTIEEEHTRARVLARLAPHLEHLSIATLYPLWCETLHILASRTRSDLLSDIGVLLPIVTVLGEKEALVTIAQAIIEVGKWFP